MCFMSLRPWGKQKFRKRLRSYSNHSLTMNWNDLVLGCQAKTKPSFAYSPLEERRVHHRFLNYRTLTSREAFYLFIKKPSTSNVHNKKWLKNISSKKYARFTYKLNWKMLAYIVSKNYNILRICYRRY